jgi:phospholipase/lecithinase/hemolysin
MRAKLVAVAAVLLISPLYAAFALPITSVNQLVVFGDSLSDNGNAAIALGGTLPGNHAPNAFTDGPNTTPPTTGPFGLWIDQFAIKSGLPGPQPFLANPAANTNYAVGSAQTGSANPQDISNQLGAFAAAHPLGAPSSALYTIWGGSNDLLNGANNPITAADNLYANILALSGAGAKYFLWLNLPPLGDVPLALALDKSSPGTSAALNAASTAFNIEWGIDLAKLRSQGVYVIGVDINSLFNQITANPAAYGFADVTDPAQGLPVNPNTFLFWDGEHPTTAGDALVANLAFNDFTAAPEPASFAFAFIGLGLIVTVHCGRKHLLHNAR